MKRVCFSLLLSLSALALCACGAKTPAQTLAQAEKNLQKVQSAAFTAELSASMTLQGRDVTVQVSSAGQVCTAPARMHAQTSVHLGSLGSIQRESYAQICDGQLVVYLTDGSGSWQKTVLDAPAQASEGAQGLQAPFPLSNAAARQDVQTLDGEPVVRYDGTISPEQVQQALYAGGLWQALGMEQPEADDAPQLPAVPISVFLSRQRQLPVRYALDLNALMHALLQRLASRLGSDPPQLRSVQCVITLSSFDEIPDIVIPEEAEQAQQAQTAEPNR